MTTTKWPEIETKDGIILRGIPDGTSEEAVKARIAEERAKLRAEQGKVPYGEFSASEAKENLPGSIKEVYEDYKHMITHPLQTIETLGAGVFGGVENIAQSMGLERPTGENLSDVGRASQEGKYQEIADAMGQYAKSRAGSWEAMKETAKTDPAGAFMDVLGVANIAAAPARLVPGLSKAGAGVQRVTAAMDPVNMAISGAKLPGKVIPHAYKKAVKDVTIEKLKNLLPRDEARSRRLMDELGGQDAIEMQKNMEASSQMVPESQPTAMQAAVQGRWGPEGMGPPTPEITRPEFVALNKPFSRRRPGDYDIAMEDQRVARLAHIRNKIAKTPAERAAKVKYRDDIADPMYKAARRDPNPVNIKPTLDHIEEILADNPKRTLVQDEYRKLKKLLTNEVTIDGKKVRVPITNAKDAVSAIEGFKDLFSKVDNSTIKGLLQKTKFKLMNNVPLYKLADAKYRELSVPINQMDIGSYIYKKLANEKRAGAVEGKSQFLTTLDEGRRTIKNSLDEPRYNSLEDVLDGPQIKALYDVQREINRDAVVAAQVKSGSHRIGEELKDVLAPPEIPGILERTVTFVRNIIKRIEGAATKKTLNFMADRQLSGPDLVSIWKAATPEERAVLRPHMSSNGLTLINQALFQSGRLGQMQQYRDDIQENQ